MHWKIFSRSSSAVFCFSLAVTFCHSHSICLCMENRTRAAVFCSSCIWSSYLPLSLASSFWQVVFPVLRAFRFRIFSCLLLMNLWFYWLLSCIFWPCRPEILGLFTLSISLLFECISTWYLSHFLGNISYFCDKNKFKFFQLNISRYFRYSTDNLQKPGEINSFSGSVRMKYNTQTT
jgi:hypothetical protein